MTRQRLSAIAAAVGLLAIVAGVPLLLYGLGGALPTGLPSAHQTTTFLGRPLADNDVLRGLSLVCWAVWFLFVIALVAEAIAWAQQRPGPSVTRRGFRIPGLQGAAGSLFLAAILLLPQKTNFRAVTTAGVVSSPAPISAAVEQSQLAELDTAGLAHSTAVDNRIPYVVGHGATLWGIAEVHVGNGLAWRQITDAEGRSFDTGADEWVQVNGRMIYERQARLIFPGETVYLPASWAPAPAAAVSQPVKDPPPAPPKPTAISPFESRTGSDGLAPVTPSTVAAPRIPETDGQAVTTADGSHNDKAVEIVGLLGAGMVAGALLSTLNRMRVRQDRYRRPGRRIRLPVADLATAELELRRIERSDLISAVHRALHALAGELLERGSPAPTICAVIASQDRIEVLLDRPGTPPTPWESSDDGHRWSLGADHIPSQLGSGAEPLPCLVPVGRAPQSDAEVLVNLAAAGVLHVRGDAEHAAGLVQATAVALTGVPWATSADVVLVGSDVIPAETAVHIRTVQSLDDVIGRLEAQVIELRDSLGDHLTAGLDRPHGWLPTAVLLSQHTSPETLARLAELCTSGAGLCAMVVSPTEAPGWTLNIEATPAVIPQLRLALEPFSPPAGWTADVCRLVKLAAATTDVGVEDPPYNQLQSGEGTAAPTLHRRSEPAAETSDSTEPGAQDVPARINVLGPVTFEGVDSFVRPRSFEIALYLALRPEGVTESRLDEMIWPSKTEVPRSTRDQAVSAARTALGGRARFPLAHGQGRDKTYRLTDQVVTDWSKFCTLYRQGRHTKSVELLRAALELIRGRPFGDLDAGPGFQWLHIEGHIHHMEAEIADAADLAATLYLEQGQPLQARWAAKQGLLAGPYTERLWVRLMAAADALGEAQEVERLLSEMDTRLGLDGDYSQLHPDTVAAYRLYSRQRVPSKP